MSNEDYDKEILREKGYIVELSNRGELVKNNPNFYNPTKQQIECACPGCSNITRSVRSLCSHHGKLKDYPLHEKDWVGRVILPEGTREEFKTWALPHGTIAELLVKWISEDEEKGKKVDKFVDETIEKIHGKIPCASTLQKIHIGEEIDAMSADELIEITKDLVEKHFPLAEYGKELINGTDKKFKNIEVGKIPLRVVLASLILAFGCEEANRGDFWGASKAGLAPKYANIFMPLGRYLLARKGATSAEARMALR